MSRFYGLLFGVVAPLLLSSCSLMGERAGGEGAGLLPEVILQNFRQLSRYGPYQSDRRQRGRLSSWMEGVKAEPLAESVALFQLQYVTGQQANSRERQSYFTTVASQYQFQLSYSGRVGSPIPESMATLRVAPLSPLTVEKDIGPDWVQLEPLDTLDQLAADIITTIGKVRPVIRHKEVVWELVNSSNSREEVVENFTRFAEHSQRDDIEEGRDIYRIKVNQKRYRVELRFVDQVDGFTNLLYSFYVDSMLYPNGTTRRDRGAEERVKQHIEKLVGRVVSRGDRGTVESLVREYW